VTRLSPACAAARQAELAGKGQSLKLGIPELLRRVAALLMTALDKELPELRVQVGAPLQEGGRDGKQGGKNWGMGPAGGERACP
jgi:hypothetical protein